MNDRDEMNAKKENSKSNGKTYKMKHREHKVGKQKSNNPITVKGEIIARKARQRVNPAPGCVILRRHRPV